MYHKAYWKFIVIIILMVHKVIITSQQLKPQTFYLVANKFLFMHIYIYIKNKVITI